ncbi:MLO-like protein 13 [Striga hermonthica]|uniref:MLO-like protein 13 n=1 Tax=Striga hermonthica TaxID=68872 RepID=A0A9N7NAN7_STRHE|nr:MLO-like protein 13 [Striga hermonthica]
MQPSLTANTDNPLSVIEDISLQPNQTAKDDSPAFVNSGDAVEAVHENNEIVAGKGKALADDENQKSKAKWWKRIPQKSTMEKSSNHSHNPEDTQTRKRALVDSMEGVEASGNIGIPEKLENSTKSVEWVGELLTDDSCEWNEELLTDLFNEDDLKLIREIKLTPEASDKWVWMFDEKGLFSVAAYAWRRKLIMSGGESGRPFEYTPTWVIAIVCFIIVFISLVAERALHNLGKYFKRKNQDALYNALEKVKEELMLLGFISLLMTVFQGLISRLCIPEHLENIMLPCKMPAAHHESDMNTVRRLLAEEVSQRCSEGEVPFLSLEALHQLHMFIFVLAVVYVFFCASTMVLGGIKISQWRHWENSIMNESSRHHRVHVPHAHLQEFTARTGNYWRKFRVVSWIAAFFKQFYGSVTRSDYIALRSGFIREHCPSNPNYNFHRYLLRTLEEDFRRIIGVSWYLWLFVVLFLLVNIAGWHTYFWLSFLPLILLLIVGAKLEHIITQLAKDAQERAGGAEGTLVRPSDELFWFQKPVLVLYLIHFILFQNSFEIAFFLWIWSTYGFESCIMEELNFIIPRIVIGIIVQVLCSYSTLPLYALVSQMGSMFKETLFAQFTKDLLLTWVSDTKHGSSRTDGSINRLTFESTNSTCLAQQMAMDSATTSSEIELSSPENISTSTSTK